VKRALEGGFKDILTRLAAEV